MSALVDDYSRQPHRIEDAARPGRAGSHRVTALLIVDEIGYLPITTGGANPFLQLVNARYEKGAMILTSNRGFAEWAEVFGDPVVATALLDRLPHHAVVVQMEGASYRLRAHDDLIHEHVRANASITPTTAKTPWKATPKQERSRSKNR